MLNITIAPEEPRDKSFDTKIDRLMDEIIPIKSPMIAETMCDHTYQYYGHDHKNDYEKCTKCSHMREVE